jgi:putative transposase
VKYAWIVSQRDQYSIPMMCELLSVSRSGLYQAMQRTGTTGSAEEERIVEEIGRAQRKHRGRYGRRRMTPEVSEALGQTLNHKRIGRLMREHGLGSRKRRPGANGDPSRAARPAGTSRGGSSRSDKRGRPRTQWQNPHTKRVG